MSYPDNFNQAAFESTWGNDIPAKEQILEADIQRINQAVIAAFKEWPLDTHHQQDQRRVIITKELERMDRHMEAYEHYHVGERGRHLMEYAGICAAIHENEHGIVEDMVSDYIGFWKNKMEEI